MFERLRTSWRLWRDKGQNVLLCDSSRRDLGQNQAMKRLLEVSK